MLKRSRFKRRIIITVKQICYTHQHNKLQRFQKPDNFSLWNLAQEIHTGRIFSPIVGGLYVLYVPLMGISTTLVLMTGVWLRLKMGKRKRFIKERIAADDSR